MVGLALTPTIRRQKQADFCEFQASYKVRLCLKKEKSIFYQCDEARTYIKFQHWQSDLKLKF